MIIGTDISSAILQLQNIGFNETERSSSLSQLDTGLKERRGILQRTLNLKDSADDLKNYNNENLYGSGNAAPSQTSQSALSLLDGENETALDSLTTSTGIRTGSFTVNGTIINIDTSSDSIDDIISRVNSSDSGVSMSFDPAENSVSITATNGEIIRLEDGSSGFFTGLNLKTGIVGSSLGDVSTFLESEAVQSRFSRFAGRFNRLFASDFTSADASSSRLNLSSAVFSSLSSKLSEGFDAGGSIRLASDATLRFRDSTVQFTSRTIDFPLASDNPNTLLGLLKDSNGLLNKLSLSLSEEAARLMGQLPDSRSLLLGMQI